MTTIYLIRHAEAEGNLYRRVHGQYDSLVTLRGRKQIAELEKRFANEKIDYVYSSDLHRTRVTAGAIYQKHGLPLFYTPQLREVRMGIWEDKTWGEVERFEPEQLDYFNNDPSRWNISGCEEFENLQSRMTQALLEISDRHNGKTVAVVSHGSAIRAFLCGVLNVPVHEIRRVKHSDNTAVARLLAEDGEFRLDYFGDNTHLPAELSTFAHQKWWKENSTFDSTNLRFVPFDLDKDAELYLKYRKDGWDAVYGHDCTEKLTAWLEKARKNAACHPRAVSLALIYDTPVGMIELDVNEGEPDKTGTIEFFYMIGEQRRTGIAVQLLGQAVSVFRPLGREKIKMAVSKKNDQALGYCKKYGFVKTHDDEREGENHFVLELDIALR